MAFGFIQSACLQVGACGPDCAGARRYMHANGSGRTEMQTGRQMGGAACTWLCGSHVLNLCVFPRPQNKLLDCTLISCPCPVYSPPIPVYSLPISLECTTPECPQRIPGALNPRASPQIPSMPVTTLINHQACMCANTYGHIYIHIHVHMPASECVVSNCFSLENAGLLGLGSRLPGLRAFKI